MDQAEIDFRTPPGAGPTVQRAAPSLSRTRSNQGLARSPRTSTCSSSPL